jgi:hypothetical protein
VNLVMILVIAALAAALALLVAALERTQGRAVEREFRGYLQAQVEREAIRNAQLEHMLDQLRAGALEIDGPADRDAHLVISAPSLRAPGRASADVAPEHSLELSIDALPEPLKSEVRAIDGEDLQREYVETIQRELAGGASASDLHARLFEV